jgi:hypothetical protein
MNLAFEFRPFSEPAYFTLMSLTFLSQRAQSPDTETTERTSRLAPCPLCQRSVCSVAHALVGLSMKYSG